MRAHTSKFVSSSSYSAIVRHRVTLFSCVIGQAVAGCSVSTDISQLELFVGCLPYFISVCLTSYLSVFAYLPIYSCLYMNISDLTASVQHFPSWFLWFDFLRQPQSLYLRFDCWCPCPLPPVFLSLIWLMPVSTSDLCQSLSPIWLPVSATIILSIADLTGSVYLGFSVLIVIVPRERERTPEGGNWH